MKGDSKHIDIQISSKADQIPPENSKVFPDSNQAGFDLTVPYPVEMNCQMITSIAWGPVLHDQKGNHASSVVSYLTFEREREIQTESEGERDRDTEIERGRDRQAGRQTERERGRSLMSWKNLRRNWLRYDHQSVIIKIIMFKARLCRIDARLKLHVPREKKNVDQ